MKQKIIMAVNNAGTNDNRVHKTASELVNCGHEVHVVGILKKNFSNYEIKDGVTYHRVKLSYSIESILAAFYKNIFLYFKPFRFEVPIIQGKKKNIKSKIFFFLKLIFSPIYYTFKIYNFLDLKTKDSFLNFPFDKLDRLKLKLIKLFFKHPSISEKAVKILFGTYLSSLFSKLVGLKGDVYYAHELWTLESCYEASQRLNAKLFYDSHELELFRNNQWSKEANKIRVSYEKKFISSADTVIAVSQGCADIIEKNYNLKKKILVIKNLPIIHKLKKSKLKLRDQLGLQEKKILIYTGLSSFNRGLENILYALEKLQGYHLVTVGNWDPEYYKNILKIIKNAKLEKRFHKVSQIQSEILPCFISDADIAVIPIQPSCLSYKYCLPNKLFEAIFAGLPVLASDLPDIKKIVNDHDIGYTFDSYSLTSFIGAVRKIELYGISNKKKDIRNKQSLFKNLFSFENEVNKINKSVLK
jgi:glycosyltransferase involved in cell wall biosynthesis